MITIIDYGMGNVGSIFNMLKRIKIESEITSDIEKIIKAKKILLPGVGAFDKAMQKITEMGLTEIINQKTLVEKVPLLGICLGMQLLTNNSEEGTLPGLGLIEAWTLKFNFTDNVYKVPHMGWNLVTPTKPSLLLQNFQSEARFYFVHSYYVKVKNEAESILKTNYGGVEFDSAVARENIYGAQFHPEKSHKYGMKLLENFARI